MCGIFGYTGSKEARPILIEGLKCLEYRGYDSAGIAVLHGGALNVCRAEGKLPYLTQKLKGLKIPGHIGIGHTRWATHGNPSERNAHPHRIGNLALVHNGIIENYLDLKQWLGKRGAKFLSDTDTEVVGHLIYYYQKESPDLLSALRRALKDIEGAYALALVSASEPEKIYIAKNRSPLVLGLGSDENFVSSDIPAILPHTKKVSFFDDGEVGFITRNSIKILGAKGEIIPTRSTEITWNAAMAQKGGYKHFMLKEIFEQPRAVEETLLGRLDPKKPKVFLEEAESLLCRGDRFNKIVITACGTSWHAGLIGKYWIEKFAKIPVVVDLASEFRYREPLIDSKTLVVPISQSGETADTLACVALAKQTSSPLLSICNVVGSSIARASDENLYTHAGPEIGVASTKTFLAQLAALFLIALRLAVVRKTLPKEFIRAQVENLKSLPQKLDRILKRSDSVKALAHSLAKSSHFLFIGRGVHYPVALEGALKLKEIAYVHAEGFAGGELKHGPIALVDFGVPVIALAPRNGSFEKMMGNIQEVKARGATVVALGDEGNDVLKKMAEPFIGIPSLGELSPLGYTIPLQLFAYFIADHKGTDIDQPRNLAKSVTVE